MTQPKASRVEAGKRKRYNSVTEMVRDLSDDSAFAESVAKEIAERVIIDRLMAMRALQELSQKDIAEKMGCTQSRVSKLENGKDDDLRIGDFHAYADALGLQLIVLLAKKQKLSIAGQINHHVSALRRLFGELSKLVGTDAVMSKGMLKLGVEATGHLATGLSELLKDIARKIPQVKDGPSPIQVEMQSDEPETACDGACEWEGCELPAPD